MKNIFYFLSLLLCIGITSCSSDDDGGGNTNETTKSKAKTITSFKFNATGNEGLNENITATINENDKTIAATVPYNTDITALLPTIEVSEGATVSPEGEQDFSSELTFTVTAEDGTKAQYTATVNIAPNTEAKITSFVFLAENNTALEDDVNAIIDEEAKTVTAYVAYGTDITGLTPTLEVSPEASFAPEDVQDFSSEIVYTITAGDESTKSDYSVNVIESSNSDAKILSFVFLAENNTVLEQDVTATIDENSKTITSIVPYGTDITALIPSVDVSPGATFIPEGPQDFSSEVTYTITAQDSTKADYTVTITVTPNNEAKILSFAFLAENNTALEDDVTATIDEDTKTITAEVPYGTDLTGLTPTLEVSPDASFSPEGAQDFSSEVVYTVTAQDESTMDYTITVQIGMDPQRAALITIYNANPGNTLGWDLDNPDIDNWEGVTTDEVGNVTELYLDYNSLTTIPAEIGQLSHLTVLSINNNKLTSIPAEIGQLSNLVGLFVSSNQLTSIPAEIGQLSNLTGLGLNYNQLTSIPAEIGELTNLEGLGLSTNQLTSIPSEIEQLSSLTSLNLAYNQLSALPSGIVQLSNLGALDLKENSFISLPTGIGQLSKLYWLVLDNNQLTSIPAEIGQLTNLTKLTVTNNQLSSIPEEIGQLTKLSDLDLSNNQLTTVPVEIGQLSKLWILSLNNNQLTSLSAEIGQNFYLDYLNLSNNQLTSIPQEVCNLETNYGTQITTDKGVTCE